MSQMFVPLENLVSKDHPYRRLLSLINFDELTKPLKKLYKEKIGRTGYLVSQGFRALLLQYVEDLSDRELERYLQENFAGLYFCGFDLESITPDFSYFSKLRARIGTERLVDLFSRVRTSLKEQGLIKEIFTFVDSSHLISKFSMWEDRDKAIKAGLEKLNNKTVGKVAKDKQARFGCKGKNKFWFGYKQHTSVDMQSGLINKIAGTPANVTDSDGLKHVCPNQGATYADKGYCDKKARRTMTKKGCHDAAIRKNNMKDKNKDKDRWISAIRAPYERVFSKLSHKTRYSGIAKTQFQLTMSALAFNLKRLIKINAPPIELVGA